MGLLHKIANTIVHAVTGKHLASPDKPKDLSKRSDQWPTVRKHHLEVEPNCQWCNGTAHVEVHHMKPFHLHPELELDPTNHITLCEASGLECHFQKGHNGTSWKDFNPNVRQDCNAKQGKPANYTPPLPPPPSH